MELIDELLKLINVLKESQISYALCGGLAMAVHGHPRATQDIDLLVPETELTRTLEVARTIGFIIPSGRMPFKARTPLAMDIYRVSKAKGSWLISLDLIVVSPGLQDVWESRISGKVGDVDCSVVSREGLIQMKAIAGRHRDLDDIETLRGGDHREKGAV